MSILIVLLIVFIINIPFGYWRANAGKFSLQWVLAVHIPVPFIIALRIFSGLGFQLYTFPFMIGAYFMGQYLGGRFLKALKNKHYFRVSSCLVMDLCKILCN
jgi:hypothetical protein